MTTDERLDRIDASIERLSQHAGQRFAALTRYLEDFRSETVVRLGAIETQMRILASSQESFEARIPPIVKSAIENAAAISYLVAKQSDQTTENFDLAARVAKLEETVAKLLPAA